MEKLKAKQGRKYKIVYQYCISGNAIVLGLIIPNSAQDLLYAYRLLLTELTGLYLIPETKVELVTCRVIT